jgi:formamidopyrimidine-DNA glycosylase
MPELPEVETVARTLRPQLVGRVITRALVLHPDVVAGVSPPAFEQRLAGAAFEEVGRRGKYLIAGLRSAAGAPLQLVVHLRMTGRLLCVGAGDELANHTHLRFLLDDGHELRLVDTRRFGRAYLLGAGGGYASSAIPDDAAAAGLLAAEERAEGRPGTGPGLAIPPKGLVELGPEPLSPGFRPRDLAAMLRGRRRQLKALLLDQSFLAGIGNIYADESLFRARLHPERKASDLSRREARRLYDCIREVLSEAIGDGGTTIRDYVDGRGRPGEFAARLRVYGREGEPCSACGTPIERHAVAGRSTYLCPRCQRL